MDKEIYIKMPIWKLLLLNLGCMLFIMLSVWIMFFINSKDVSFGLLSKFYLGKFIIGPIAILFFGYGFIISIKRLISNRVTLKISYKGIQIKKEVFIEWDRIKKIGKLIQQVYDHNGKKLRKNKFLSIFLKEPLSNKGKEIGDYLINQIELPNKIEDIFDILKNYPVEINIESINVDFNTEK